MISLEEYKKRLADRQTVAAGFDRQHIRIGNIRLLIGIAAAVIAWAAFSEHTLTAWWLVAPVVAFILLAIWHERILRGRTFAKRAVHCYERGIGRIEDRWMGSGEPGARFLEDGHPYAEDLDLFGKGSLFQLLSLARTRVGENTLAGWLKAPASAEEILKRQQAVTELRAAVDLRESIFVLGEDARDTVRTEHLVQWAEAPPVLQSGLPQLGAILVSILVASSAAAMFLLGWGRAFIAALGIAAIYGFWLRGRVLTVLRRVDEALHDLELLSALVRLMETATFEAAPLRALQQKLSAQNLAASHQIARLNRLDQWISSRDNPLVRVVGPPLLMGTHLAFAVERWRASVGGQIRHWLNALSEMEALLSLSAYSYEHPADPFPQFTDAYVLQGDDLGHPLIPGEKCVRNPISLDDQLQLLVVSGSNMSGKSTYLRAIGINVVMAMAGAPVRAKSLKLCPLQVGSTIRVNDSLQGGSSRFFAEITRLRKVVDLAAGNVRVLFLLDEMLAGTNSHDRKLGAEGIIRELLSRKAMGLVTTHDMALTSIAEVLAPLARNVHFEDHLEGGKLNFDYKVRTGVVTKSNALELMRSIGLRV